MPYIEQSARQRLDAGAAPQTSGELNYLITRLVDSYLSNKGELKYSHINEVVGVLECVKQELYRRIASPYEDQKQKQNGDVYQSINKSEQSE